jgi:hypothetical protein
LDSPRIWQQQQQAAYERAEWQATIEQQLAMWRLGLGQPADLQQQQQRG